MKRVAILLALSFSIAVSAQDDLRQQLRDLAQRELQTVRIDSEVEHKVKADRVIVTATVTTKGRDLPDTMEKNRLSRTALQNHVIGRGLLPTNVVYQPFSFNSETGFFTGKSYELTSRVQITATNEFQFASVIEVLASRKSEWEFLDYETTDSRQVENEEAALLKALAQIKRRKELFEKHLNLSLTAIRFGEESYIAAGGGGGGLGGASLVGGAPVLDGQGNPIASSVLQNTDSFGQISYHAHVVVSYATKPSD